MNKQASLERLFEAFLWNSRLGTIIVVVLSALGSLGMFILGALDIIGALKGILTAQSSEQTVLISVIRALDLFLVGIVLVIFSFGVYELFISRLKIPDRSQYSTILDITSLDVLKSRLLKVIIMILIVGFAQTVLSMQFTSALEMLYLALSILALSASVFLTKK